MEPEIILLNFCPKGQTLWGMYQKAKDLSKDFPFLIVSAEFETHTFVAYPFYNVEFRVEKSVFFACGSQSYINKIIPEGIFSEEETIIILNGI